MKKYTTASFDVFDTCITRSCGSPDNFLDVLSTKVFKTNVDETTRQQFILYRKEAEEISFCNNNKATIYDIYNTLSFNNPHLKEKEELIEIEIELEACVCTPVFSVKNLIEQLRASNVHIIFISDMYLPSSVLKPILFRNGIIKDNDELYISCDYGYSKKNASLFEYIHEKEKIEYDDWIHYGDNKLADIISPSRLGIHTVLVNHTYNIYPKRLYKSTDMFKFKYRSILAGLSRSLYHSFSSNNRKALITDIIAPLYCSFINSIFIDATQKGISRLFFCARDCYHIYNMAKVINQNYPHIIIKYLYISREALKNTSTEILMSYFIQEGVASKEQLCAIVDVTTTGQTQTIINQLLTTNNYNLIHAYNLIKYDSPNKKYSDILSIDFCRQKYAQINNTTKLLFELKVVAPLIESIFSVNPEKRTVGYQKEGKRTTPIFSKINTNQDCIQKDIEYMENYQTSILTEYAKSYITLGLGIFSNTILTEIAIKQLNDLFLIPEKLYIKGLQDCKLIENGKIIPFIKKEKLFYLLIDRGKSTLWDRATVIYNLPIFLSNIFIKQRIVKKIYD